MTLITQLRRLMIPIKEMDMVLPATGLIYEIGSGVGVIAYEIAKTGNRRQVIGIDRSSEKINQAKLQFKLKNLDYKGADAISYSYKPCVGVVMSDFLHHLDYQAQEKVLQRASKKLKPGGVMVVKEIAKDDGIFMILSRMWDFVFYPKDHIHYRSRAEWRNLIAQLGYDVSVKRKMHWFPGSTHLFVCQKI